MITIYLGLGSSLGHKEQIITDALLEIQTWGSGYKVSSFVYSDPWGGVAQNQFLNVVCSFQVPKKEQFGNASPQHILEKIQRLEQKFQRTRLIKWDDRTLDVDILLYGKKKIQTNDLIIPHPYILERDFVYNPLLEVFRQNTNTLNTRDDLIQYITDIRNSNCSIGCTRDI